MIISHKKYVKNNQNTPLLFLETYGIICAVPTGKREYPKANENNEKRKTKMGNEEMIAELKAQLLVKEARVRKLAKLAGEILLTRENLPALETYAVELRSLAYQIRQLLVAKSAALAAR